MINLQKELTNINEHKIVLVVEDATEYLKTNIKILRIFCNDKKIHGIYITANRPYESIKKLLEENKIDSAKLFFIDTITNTKNIKSKKVQNCIYISSAESLTEISIAISELVKIIPGKDRFLFLDSITTLLMYNSAGTTTKFVHFLTNKIREWGISGVLVSLERETDEKLISQLSQFVDKIIYVHGGKNA
ncbi:MAG: ATPase domain-containing protein [Candidatus Aenigmarchaeota archaeon]|nr:ATPase domain-containing protein [Candidatus Aenigmarchaeota archaeon]